MSSVLLLNELKIINPKNNNNTLIRFICSMNYTTTKTIQKLKNSLALDLPGQHFQNLMSPVEAHEKYRIIPKDHKVACVMALIHPKANGPLNQAVPFVNNQLYFKA